MSIPVSITMGVAPLSKTDDYVTAISAAYSALKKAKFNHRGGYSVYSEEMNKDLTQRVNILNSLRDALKQVGVHVSLGDFGTGYSSLVYLQRMNLDRIKVDRSFVMQSGQSQTSERIIRSIINLGRQLKLDLLAEGIETADQENFLKDANCNSAQGYRFTKPMDYESLLSG